MASDYAQPLPATTKLEGKALEILQPIVDKYKGKYVQIEWMKPGKSGFDFVNNRMVNLIPDFRNHKDLQFVFFVQCQYLYERGVRAICESVFAG